MTISFVKQNRARASEWKKTLPSAAHAAGKYGRQTYDFCLPLEHAWLNLLPSVRGIALPSFRDHELLNRPGSGGGSQPMKDESHVSTEEVQRRAA